jgi:hypothetical protein
MSSESYFSQLDYHSNRSEYLYFWCTLQLVILSLVLWIYLTVRREKKELFNFEVVGEQIHEESMLQDLRSTRWGLFRAV